LQAIWSTVRELDRRAWLGALVLGILARLVAIIGVFYLFRSVGLPLPFVSVLLISILYTFVPLLPVNVVAGLGITEAYLIACFVASGVERAVAAVASLQIHALQLGIATVLAAAGFVQLHYQSTRTPGAHRR
jgi:uncharacterized membrane protein YbhN (UPF0104 family)